jgi:MFS family permease
MLPTQRNINLFYVIRGLALPFFWLPILYFYLTQIKGFSPVQTTFLLALQEFLLIFLELPTGVVADKVSRKFSITLGYLITSIPFALFPWVHSFEIFILLFGVKAVGKALVSGADTALLYDSLLDLGRTSEYKQIVTKAGAWTMGVAAVAMVLGGWLGQHSLYNWALWLPLPLQVLGAVAAAALVEPETSKKAQILQESNYLKHVWAAAKLVMTQQGVLALALIFAILEGTGVNLKWYYPAIFEHFGMGLLLTGVVMAGLYFGRTLTGIIGHWLIQPNPLKNSWIWVSNIGMAWFSMAVIFHWWTAIPALIVIIMGLEFATNSTEELIHDSLDSKTRATAMSFVNLLSSIGATLLLLTWGKSIESNGLSLAIWAQVGIFVVVLGLLGWYKNHRQLKLF